jgi:hypothetical protein
VSGVLLAPLLAARWLGEVPPPPPQAIFALMELLKLVAMSVALGLTLTWNQTLGKLFAWLGDALNVTVFHHHPLGFIAHGLKAANDRVVNFLGHIALVNEGGMVTWISWTGNTTEHAAKAQAAHAESTTAAFDRLQTVFLPYFVTGKIAPLHKTIGQAKAAAHTATKAAGHATTQAKVATHTASHTKAIAQRTAIAVVQPRVGALEHWRVNVVKDLNWVRGRFKPLTFAALVAVALSRLGLGWLRCPSLLRMGRRIGCGGFAFAESLMALSFAPLLLQDACALVRQYERLAVAIQPALADFVLGVEGWVCGGPKSLPSGIVAGDLKRVAQLPSGL